MIGSEVDSWRQACDQERKAWAKAREALPGSAGHNPVVWKQWQEAIERVDEARRRMMDSLGNHDE
jgi:hypothetical protein